MNKSLIILLAFLALALAACSGAPGSTGSVAISDIPSISAGNVSGDNPLDSGASSGLTEAGDVEDEATRLNDGDNSSIDDPSLDIYENRAFAVKIVHPLEWTTEEPSAESVRFSSDKGDALDVSFIILRQAEVGLSFESFLDNVRGGSEGLVSVVADGFEKALCAKGDADATGLVDVECYYLANWSQASVAVAVTGSVTGGLDAFYVYLLGDPELDARTTPQVLNVRQPMLRVQE